MRALWETVHHNEITDALQFGLIFHRNVNNFDSVVEFEQAQRVGSNLTFGTAVVTWRRVRVRKGLVFPFS